MNNEIAVFEAAITRYYSYQAMEHLPEVIDVTLYTAEMRPCPEFLRSNVHYAPLLFRSFHHAAWRISHFRRWIPDLYKYFDQLTRRRLRQLACENLGVAHLWSGTSLETLRWAREHFDGNMIVERSGSHVELQYQMLCEEAQRTSTDLGVMPVFDPVLRERMLEEYELADTILVPSHYAKKSFVDAGIAADKVAVIPLGTNASPVKEMPVKRKKLTVLFVGGEPLRKGLFTLLEVWRSLAPDAELCVITDQSRVPREKRNITGVSFLPFMGHAGLKQLMSECHLLCLPSVEDGFGMVVSEAMAMGTAVLVSTNCGASELVSHGKNGSVFEAGDASCLMEQLGKLLASKSSLMEMCEGARCSLGEATWAVYAQRLADLYWGLSNA